MKLFLFSVTICIFAAIILFELHYVGVTMAWVLLGIIVFFGIIAYFTFPKAIKEFKIMLDEL